MIPEIIQEQIQKGTALKRIDEMYYPPRFGNKVPLKVRMNVTVQSDMPAFIAKNYKVCFYNEEYYVTVNSYGAVTAIHNDGSMLGLKPKEFEVIEWHT